MNYSNNLSTIKTSRVYLVEHIAKNIRRYFLTNDLYLNPYGHSQLNSILNDLVEDKLFFSNDEIKIITPYIEQKLITILRDNTSL